MRWRSWSKSIMPPSHWWISSLLVLLLSSTSGAPPPPLFQGVPQGQPHEGPPSPPRATRGPLTESTLSRPNISAVVPTTFQGPPKNVSSSSVPQVLTPGATPTIDLVLAADDPFVYGKLVTTSPAGGASSPPDSSPGAGGSRAAGDSNRRKQKPDPLKLLRQATKENKLKLNNNKKKAPFNVTDFELMESRDKRSRKKHSVYIAGFFPLSFNISEGSVGRGVLPAVRLALFHINESPDFLEDYNLEISYNDTKCSAAEGMKSFFDMMYQKPSKVMLFGDACTQVTDPIAKASKHWKVSQLSYADMHPQFSKKNYPNLFRIVPSENEFNAPRIQLLKQFNWTRVGTLYQNDPRYALAHNKLVSDLEKSGVDVVTSQSFQDVITSQLQALKEKDVRIILGNFNETWARKIFCEAYREHLYGRKYQWLIVGTYARQWWRKGDVNCSITEIETALRGAILVDLLPLSTTNEPTVNGRTANDYQEIYDVVAQGEYSRFHGYAYDGIWAIALALNNISNFFPQDSRGRPRKTSDLLPNFRYRDGQWERAFLSALEATSFIGVTGLVQFRDNGRKGSVLIKQFQAFNTVNAEVKVGEYDGVTETLSLVKGRNITWNGKSPPKDRTYNKEVHVRINITLFAVMSTASSLGIFVASFFLAVNIKFRNQRYIKMSSPYLNNLIIIGCILTYTSIIVLGLDSALTSEAAFPYICTARAWILMAGFTLAFGSMFSKTWRVHSIFTNVKLNKKVIKDMQLFIVVGILLALDFAIMTTWHFVDPFYRETKKMEGYVDSHNEDVKIIPINEYCRSHHMNIFVGCIYAYKGLLLMFGCFLAWETRHVSIPALNDSKYIGMSVYNSVMMCLIGAPLSHVLSDKQDANFVIISIFILFCTTATLCLVFLPKLIELKRNPNGTIEKRLRTTVKPPFSTRRSSATSLYETELKSAKQGNQRYRKQIREIDTEIQALAKLVGHEAQEILHDVMHNLALPKSDVLKKEDTDVSSLYSFNSEGEDVFVESPERKPSKYPGGLPAPWQAVTAGVLNSAKTILFAPELGAALQEKRASIVAIPALVTATAAVTSPSEEPLNVEEKSLPQRLEQQLNVNNGTTAPPPGGAEERQETLLDLYNQIVSSEPRYQPIQYPLQYGRLNKSEHDILRIIRNQQHGQQHGAMIHNGAAYTPQHVLSLSNKTKKASASESHLTVLAAAEPGGPSTTTQEELWATINKERRYMARNSNEVVVTAAELQNLRRNSYIETTSKFTISIPNSNGVGGPPPSRKFSVPVLPLVVRRQQTRESRMKLKSSSPTSEQAPKMTVNTIDGGPMRSVIHEEVRKPKSLKSPTAIVNRPMGLQLKTEPEEDEILFSSENDLPNFSSSMTHIDHCPDRLRHHSSSMKLGGGTKRLQPNYSSSDDIPQQGSIGQLCPGPVPLSQNPNLAKYRSYSVPKRLDNSVLNFSEINLDVSLLPIFHKLLSERRSLRDHRRHLSQARPISRSKAEKEKFMVSCPNIMIKCDIVEYL